MKDLFKNKKSDFTKLIILVGLISYIPNIWSQSQEGQFNNFKIDPIAIADAFLGEHHENPLYGEIYDHFNNHRDEIESRQLQIIERGRNAHVFGGLNHIGLNYTKGFANFSIELKRQVAPDLFDDERWLVTDTFSIHLDASKVLGNLKEQEVIDISDQQLALFAGLTFRRRYEHMHFADSYEEASAFNLDRLFYGFTNFRSPNFLDFKAGEFFKKEDSFSLQAGGYANAPLMTGLSAHVGALVKYQNLSTTTMQTIDEEDESFPGEFLRISTEKSKSFNVGVSAGVIADFMGILRLSLLKLDFNYELTESYKAYLSFHRDEIDYIQSDNEVSKHVARVLKHQKADLNVLGDYLVSEERRKIENKNLKYRVLIFGAVHESQTSHIEIVKDDKILSFFRHNYEHSKYQENIFSRIFGALIKTLTKVSSVVNKAKIDIESLRIEYESETDLIHSQGDFYLGENTQSLSLNFMKDFYSYKMKKNVRTKMYDFIEEFSGSDPLVARKIKETNIQGPVEFSTNFSFGQDAMYYFHNLSVGGMYDVVDDICKTNRGSGFFSWFSRLLKVCERKLKRSYDAYQKEWRMYDVNVSLMKGCQLQMTRMKNYKIYSALKKRMFIDACMQKVASKASDIRAREIPLWRLKDLAQKLLKEIPSKVYYYRLFGYQNVFIHGEISAVDENGVDFVHFFREGIFKGIGAVQNSLKKEGLRSAASVNEI